MDLNRLTQKSQQAVQEAQTKALRYGHVEIDGEHLLLALLEQRWAPPTPARAEECPWPAAAALWSVLGAPTAGIMARSRSR
jgi:hypothetical protein